MSSRIASMSALAGIALLALLGSIGPESARGQFGVAPRTEEDREHSRRMEKLQRELQILQARAAIKQAEIQKAQAEYQLRKLEEADRAEEKTTRAEPATLNRPLTVEEERAVRNKLTIEDAQRAAIPFPDEVIIDFVPADGQDRTKQGEKRIRVRPDNSTKTRAILDALDRPLAMPFPDKTPLDQVIRYIKKSTAGDRLPDGIPIYVDPDALDIAQQTMESKVTLKSEGAPLKESLRTLLGQIDLDYEVRDGLLTVVARRTVEFLQRGGTSEAAVRKALEMPVDMPFPNETPLEEVIKYVKKATAGPDLPDGIPIYVDPVGLQLSASSVASTVRLNLAGVPLKRSLRLILRQLGLDFAERAGVVRIDTREGLDDPADGIPAGKLGDDPKSRAILDALARPVNMPFADVTPLEDVLKHIKSATVGPELPDGIPIYVEPRALQGRALMERSPVKLDLKGVPLRQSLRLILKPLGLTYTVKDGLLTITSMEALQIQRVEKGRP